MNTGFVYITYVSRSDHTLITLLSRHASDRSVYAVFDIDRTHLSVCACKIERPCYSRAIVCDLQHMLLLSVQPWCSLVCEPKVGCPYLQISARSPSSLSIVKRRCRQRSNQGKAFAPECSILPCHMLRNDRVVATRRAVDAP